MFAEGGDHAVEFFGGVDEGVVAGDFVEVPGCRVSGVELGVEVGVGLHGVFWGGGGEGEFAVFEGGGMSKRPPSVESGVRASAMGRAFGVVKVVVARERCPRRLRRRASTGG